MVLLSNLSQNTVSVSFLLGNPVYALHIYCMFTSSCYFLFVTLYLRVFNLENLIITPWSHICFPSMYDNVTSACMLCGDRRISHVRGARSLSRWVAREVIQFSNGV